MESPADCQRARETWSYGRQEHSRQIRASAHHAPAPSSVTDLEDVCSQSPGGDDCYRLSNRPTVTFNIVYVFFVLRLSYVVSFTST